MSPSDDAKRLATLAARYALVGLELTAETGLDGLTRLHTIYCGKVQHLNDLDRALAFLTQIGGANA